MNSLLLPDLFILLQGFTVLGIDLFSRKREPVVTFQLTWSGLLFNFILLLCLPYDRTVVFFGTYQVSGLALLFKQIFVISAFFTVLLSRYYFTEKGNFRGPMRAMGEFYGIVLFCTFGMFTVVSATGLLTLFIGMELATIPLYVLSAFRKGDDLSAEASTKFIVMGALSTGILLFGYSFIYGAVGSLRFVNILAFATQYPLHPLLFLGLLFIFAAIGFKLTLFPFHMWAPDVYEGAPTPVTAFISVSSKATAIAFLIVLLYGPLAPLHPRLQYLILLLAGATMTVGNLGALKQKNLCRFMAYSSIAQAGYILLALAGQAEMGRASIIYYLLIYAAANYATFFIISIVSQKRTEEFASLRGLGKQSPTLAAILLLSMFSLAGIPPLAGFIGKFMLFASAAQEGYYFMVIFAALNSTVSLYYYLLLIKEAYILQPTAGPMVFEVSFVQQSSLAILTVFMILLGLVPMISTKILLIVQ